MTYGQAHLHVLAAVWQEEARKPGLQDDFIFDGNRVTAAGVSAGLDFALALAARLRGEDYARTTHLVAEYAPKPPFEAGSPAAAGPTITRRAQAILDALATEARKAAATLNLQD